jgi:hypothetical protein
MASFIKASHKGRYHEHLGLPEGAKIPLSDIHRDIHSKDAHVRKMAQFALNARHFKH